MFTMPGGNLLVIHLKDKTKIRIKKRWSQVMYMYQLLAYRACGSLAAIKKLYEDTKSSTRINDQNTFKGFGYFLKNIEAEKRKKLENTFILTLDGDIEFEPLAVKLMVDKIRKNPKIGSVCGRVFPIGSGKN